MVHFKSSFFFQSKNDTWRVDYQDKVDNGWKRITCQVYFNDELYHDFGNGLPGTNTQHPTKTQAREIISASRKHNKEVDKRDKKLKKILE